MSTTEIPQKAGWKKRILGLIVRANKDHVGAYSASAAYFIIMAFIPFLLFLTTLVRYTTLSYNTVREGIMAVVPLNLQSFVLSIVADVYKRSDAIMPIAALMALWSAGKGLQSLTNGLNSIYHVKETRNWLVNRIRSVMYTFVLVLALIISLLFMVLGRQLRDLVNEYNPFIGRVLARITGQKNLYLFLIMILLFATLYRFLPNRRSTFAKQLPGAFFTACAWMIFSFLFSLYFKIFPGFSNTYGNLTAITLLMLWLYICMMIMLYGAEINSYFEFEFSAARVRIGGKVKERRSRRKHGKMIKTDLSYKDDKIKKMDSVEETGNYLEED